MKNVYATSRARLVANVAAATAFVVIAAVAAAAAAAASAAKTPASRRTQNARACAHNGKSKSDDRLPSGEQALAARASAS